MLFKRAGAVKFKSLNEYRAAVLGRCNHAARYNTIISPRISQKKLGQLLEVETYPTYVGIILSKIKDTDLVLCKIKDGDSLMQDTFMDECGDLHKEVLYWLATFADYPIIRKRAKELIKEDSSSISFVLTPEAI